MGDELTAELTAQMSVQNLYSSASSTGEFRSTFRFAEDIFELSLPSSARP